MVTEPIIKPDSIYTEAPASWNTSYVTSDGFVCRITLRGDNGKDLLEKANTAMAFLREHGFRPDQKPTHNNNREVQLCPIHQSEMRRYEKDGKSWFSHKTEDGKWCRGKQKGS